MLEAYIRKQREQKEILLMTHLVLGYPDFDVSLRLVEAMVESGVELIGCFKSHSPSRWRMAR